MVNLWIYGYEYGVFGVSYVRQSEIAIVRKQFSK